MPATDIPNITLNNGVTMPQLGLGVYQAESGDQTQTAIEHAITSGYRLIDTAKIYGNEADVGRAVKNSGVPREDMFITTKLWNSDQGADKVRPAFLESLKKLDMEYVDLYLIHWPMPGKNLFVETWKELEKLYAEKKIRAIGVSNFSPEHLDILKSECEIVPAVNQIELHPDFAQVELREYDKVNDIQTESWSPIGGSGGKLLENETLQKIGEKHGKTSAQVVIRWHLQSGLIVIPKSTHHERIDQNFDVTNFELSPEEMDEIDALDCGNRQGPDPATMNVA